MRVLWKELVNSCIYAGNVGHSRYQPVTHRFRYSLFMMYLDLAELEQVFEGRIFWSVNRPNLAWFRRRDYMGDPDLPLDTTVREEVQRQLGYRPAGPIRMLSHLRYFGHNFNPVTFYYCFDQAGSRLEAIVANITNTPWGERYSYVLNTSQKIDLGQEVRFRFAKNFHVSPFMDMNVEYDWWFGVPGDSLQVQMILLRDGARQFSANLDLKRRELNGSNLSRMLLSYPPMTLKVIAGIYWQALRLWIKGATFYAHPSKSGQAR
jgi:DUF1365 family protein